MERGRAVKVLIRVGISVLFVGVVAWSVEDWGRVGRVLGRADPVRGGLYALLMVGTILEMGLRWGLLLRAAGIQASFGGAIAVAYTGAFFNQFSIGSAGGDIARGVLVVRETDLKVRAVATILLDRAIGLVTLVLMGLAAALAGGHRGPALILGAIAGSIGLGALVYYNPWLRRTGLAKGFKERYTAARMLGEVDAVLMLVLRRPGLLAFCVGITVVGQAMVIAAVWGLAGALQIPAITLSHCFSMLPIIFVSMALPISIGGFGVGEKAFIEGFKTFGVGIDEALGLALAFRIANFATSFPGIVVFLLGKATTTRNPRF